MKKSARKTPTPVALDPSEIGEVIILGDDLRWTYSILTGEETFKSEKYSSPVQALKAAAEHVEKLLNPNPCVAW